MTSICLLVQGVYDSDPRVRRKAEALASAGYSVDVLALRPQGGSARYTLNGVHVYTLALGKLRGSLLRYLAEYAIFFVWAAVQVTRLMRRRRYAVIDVNTLPDFLIFAPMIARWMGATLVLDMHEITPEFYQSKYGIGERAWVIRLLTFIERISFTFADRVVTINEPILNLLAGRGLPRQKTTVIMNSADETRFAAALGDPAASGQDHSDPFVMIYHGTLTRIYGLDIAIEAFAAARQQMPNAEMWILGSGPEQEPLARLASERDMSDKVKLIGQVPSLEIPAWLSKATVGILPLRRDALLDFAFPNKLPEFIIMRRPVIMSRLGAIQHYFSEAALAYFEPNNVADLSAQMMRLYRDTRLRSDLVARASEEYVPMRWELMKAQYLRMIAAIVNPGNRTADAVARAQTRTVTMPSRTDMRPIALKLLAYCHDRDWAGHDPYDALNSRIFAAVPLLDSRIPRIIATQALKRSPVDLRRPMLIPPTQNPKALALFLGAALRLRSVEGAHADTLVDALIERLIALRSPGTSAWCWGYSFPWQTRTRVVPRGTPNLVCTVFVAGALLDAYEQQGDRRCLDMAVSAARYILTELYRTDGDRVAGFSYPLPSMPANIHNANFLAAALLCRLSRLTGDVSFSKPGLSAARWSAARQQVDGSWMYGDGDTQQWIDNFHTGYNLCALDAIGRDLETQEFRPQLARGFDFYRAHFFREDGAARYFHDQTYPIDIHCVAQSIITLVTLRDLDPGNIALATSVLRWAIDHMWDERGFFYYRVLRFATIRTSYMRWSQAWMLFALSTFLAEAADVTASSPSHRSLAIA